MQMNRLYADCSILTAKRNHQGYNRRIDTYEDLLKEFDIPDDDGIDYIGLQLSQGLPVVYW